MVNKLISYCDEKLDLKNTHLDNEYYYSCLTNCLIDAVFSIGIKYSTTKNIIINFCKYMNIQEFREFNSVYPDIKFQFSIEDLILLYEKNTLEEITEKIYKNKNRTSSRNGILKSQAVLECAKILQKYDVNYFQDIYKIQDNSNFELDFKSVKGQGSGISLKYFFMLTGNDDLIKPDRMIERFVYDCLKVHLVKEDIIRVFDEVILELKKRYPDLTLRKLDHEIWKYQR